MYEVAEYQFDMYVLFWEQSIRLAGRNGIVAFITPNTWLNNQGTTKLRRYMLANTQVLSILDCTRQTVFESVVVLPIVTMLQRIKSSNNVVSILEPIEDGFEVVNQVPSRLWLEDDICIFNTSLRAEDVSVRAKILAAAVPLEQLATVKFGVKLYETGKGIPPQKSTAAKEHIYVADKKQGKDYRKYLEGKDVGRYAIDWEGRWLKYGPNLAAPRDAELFEGPRLLFRRIVGERLIGAYVDEDFVSGQLLQIVKPHDPAMAKALLAILNSTVVAYYFVKKYNRQDVTFPEIRIYELASLPIPKVPAKVKAQLEKLVEKRLHLSSANATASEGEASSAKARQIEKEIDQMVYGLYGLTEEEIKIVESSGKKKVNAQPAGEQ
jgi:hypothetical protein